MPSFHSAGTLPVDHTLVISVQKVCCPQKRSVPTLYYSMWHYKGLTAGYPYAELLIASIYAYCLVSRPLVQRYKSSRSELVNSSSYHYRRWADFYRSLLTASVGSSAYTLREWLPATTATSYRRRVQSASVYLTATSQFIDIEDRPPLKVTRCNNTSRCRAWLHVPPFTSTTTQRSCTSFFLTISLKTLYSAPAASVLNAWKLHINCRFFVASCSQ